MNTLIFRVRYVMSAYQINIKAGYTCVDNNKAVPLGGGGGGCWRGGGNDQNSLKLLSKSPPAPLKYISLCSLNYFAIAAHKYKEGQ